MDLSTLGPYPSGESVDKSRHRSAQVERNGTKSTWVPSRPDPGYRAPPRSGDPGNVGAPSRGGHAHRRGRASPAALGCEPTLRRSHRRGPPAPVACRATRYRRRRGLAIGKNCCRTFRGSRNATLCSSFRSPRSCVSIFFTSLIVELQWWSYSESSSPCAASTSPTGSRGDVGIEARGFSRPEGHRTIAAYGARLGSGMWRSGARPITDVSRPFPEGVRQVKESRPARRASRDSDAIHRAFQRTSDVSSHTVCAISFDVCSLGNRMIAVVFSAAASSRPALIARTQTGVSGSGMTR